MKCGTTSLHYYLRKHPDIYMPIEKELDYFIKERNFERGSDWYTSKFNSNYPQNGEASPNYTKAHLFEGVPKRIYELIPEVKLIFLYRDPVERAYSQYIHNRSTGLEKLKPEEAITASSNYIMISKYYWQLQQYMEYFDKKQILLLDSNNLKNKRKLALKRVYEFLEIDYFYDKRHFDKNRHQSGIKTKRNRLNAAILKTSIGDCLKKLAPEEIKIFYKRISEKPLQVPALTAELKEKLNKYLEKDWQKFNEFLDQQNVKQF